LDVKAAGKQAEVQKEQESVTDWTLKLREACGSPKGARKRDGLDVEAAGGMAEVQKREILCLINCLLILIKLLS